MDAWRFCRAAALAVLFAALLPLSPAPAQDASLEYAVKGAFLYKLGPFVVWPPHAFAAANTPVNLCLLGGDPFGVALDQAVAGQQVGSRPIAVRRLAAIERGVACHILYIAVTDPRLVAEVLEAVRGTPALTVTDGMRDPRAKGIVNFVIQANRVRFEIDDFAAAQNGLEISSKVLSLAVSVRPRS
jgi:hypothetical protein